MKTKKCFTRICAAAALAVAAGSVSAASLTGAYDTRTSDGSKTTPAGSVTGPWTLTSTDATASWLRRYVDQMPTFAELTQLDVVFSSPVLNAQVNSDGPISQALLNAGGGGGAPRLSLALDSDGDLAADQFIDIHLGSSPGFVDSPAALNTFSGMNLIGNNDAGRYDLSGAGGSVFTNYAAALSLLGSSRVLRGSVFVDSYGGADKTLEITSIEGASSAEGTVAVPLPAAAWGGMLLLGGLGGVKGLKRLRRREV